MPQDLSFIIPGPNYSASYDILPKEIKPLGCNLPDADDRILPTLTVPQITNNLECNTNFIPFPTPIIPFIPEISVPCPDGFSFDTRYNSVYIQDPGPTPPYGNLAEAVIYSASGGSYTITGAGSITDKFNEIINYGPRYNSTLLPPYADGNHVDYDPVRLSYALPTLEIWKRIESEDLPITETPTPDQFIYENASYLVFNVNFSDVDCGPPCDFEENPNCDNNCKNEGFLYWKIKSDGSEEQVEFVHNEIFFGLANHPFGLKSSSNNNIILFEITTKKVKDVINNNLLVIDSGISGIADGTELPYFALNRIKSDLNSLSGFNFILDDDTCGGKLLGNISLDVPCKTGFTFDAGFTNTNTSALVYVSNGSSTNDKVVLKINGVETNWANYIPEYPLDDPIYPLLEIFGDGGTTWDSKRVKSFTTTAPYYLLIDGSYSSAYSGVSTWRIKRIVVGSGGTSGGRIEFAPDEVNHCGGKFLGDISINPAELNIPCISGGNFSFTAGTGTPPTGAWTSPFFVKHQDIETKLNCWYDDCEFKFKFENPFTFPQFAIDMCASGETNCPGVTYADNTYTFHVLEGSEGGGGTSNCSQSCARWG